LDIKLTNHGAKRLRERLGLPKKACKRAAQLAFDKGMTFKDTTGPAYRYFHKIYAKNTAVNNTKIYGQFAYLFADNVLVTVLNLPKDITFVKKTRPL